MKRVFVGLSGGVDSAVSAHLLMEAGYDVVGVFIKVWEPDFLPCTSGQDRLDAMRVAAHLKIPFLSYNLEEEYKKSVVDYFIAEYKVGRTPNPDVMCNRTIKFGAFWEQAKKDGADFIATGHYARIQKVERSGQNIVKLLTTDYQLLAGPDNSKDQSYFLWTLTQDDLAHALFPVGGLEKKEVRRIAASLRLPNATKKDSQGLCFLGHVDMKEFLQHYIPTTRGTIKNEHGDVVGEHDGAVFYTLGQRVPVSGSEKMYVTEKNIDTNEIVVATSLQRTTGRTRVNLTHVNWIRETPWKGTPYVAQTRYHGEKIPCSVEGSAIVFKDPVQVAEGQSVVIYDPETDECIGGGVA